jgi:IS5 family transposase
MLQTRYNLSDPAVEELCYDRISFQKFLDIDVNTTSIPDETTIVNFRKFMNENNIQKQLFDKINTIISSKKIIIKE